MKPSPLDAATSKVLSASWCAAQEKTKLVSGVIPKGGSRRPKWVRYMVSSPAAWYAAKKTGMFRSWLTRGGRLGAGLVTGAVAILFAPVAAILGMAIIAHAIARV